MTDAWTSLGTIETYTGGAFDLFDPDPADVRLADIAAGLAHTCRFGGHCRQFYSVAHHSIHVSRELSTPRLQLLGLLHDAAEAYVGDVPRPMKAALDGFEAAEHEILDTVWTALDVVPPTDEEWEQVMTADDRLLAYEASELLADGSWAEDPAPLGYDLDSVGIDAVRDQYRSRAESLLDSV